jgi:Ca2+-binding RTX toxin-like protein
VLDGGFGEDKLDGGRGNDLLTGGEGNDALDGGAGIDAADYREEGGESGIVADLGVGTVVDTWGTTDTLKNIEIIKGSVNDDTIAGSEKTDYLDGWAGDDELTGEGGADELYGARGDDLLDGGEGSDYLDGGLGDDKLFGGEKWDFFVGRMDEGDDVVMDFEDVDLIDLRNTSFKSFDQITKLMSYEETDFGGGVLLKLGTGSMLILGVQELTAEDVLFKA